MESDSLSQTVPWNNDRQPLAERLVADMVRRWQAGERPTVDDYLTQHPELLRDKQAVLLLVYEEFCLREAFGEPPLTLPSPPGGEGGVRGIDGILARFPEWRTDLEMLFECHRLVEPARAAARPQDEPPELADYVILDELGRGTQGVVYLATQGSLANRPVVLKVTPRVANEHLALARLQHTGIVPLYAVHDSPEQNTRTLCMPYFGGATLQQLLNMLADKPVPQRTGKDLLRALDAIQAEAALSTAGQGRSRTLLEGASYIEAICWMGMSLAEALQYAHERSLVHLDIKPTNVLFTADGQPMLLDFHSAQPPIRPHGAPPDWLGGTPLYMSPEQSAALQALQVGEPIPALVDGRSDIYSLGLIMYEALGGNPSAPLSCSRLPVSPGLRDILSCCLASDPQLRYASAAALADDLKRHLNNMPLRGVSNRSLRERWRKWRKRRPFMLRLVVMAAAVLAAVLSLSLVTLSNVQHVQKEAQDALRHGREQITAGDFVQAIATLKIGLGRANSLPGDRDLIAPLKLELARAERAAALEKLHTFVEQLRFVSGEPRLPARTKAALTAAWQQLWPQRQLLLNRARFPLPNDLEERAKTDLIDAGLIWSDLLLRLTPPLEKKFAEKDALDIVTALETAFGRSPVLAWQRRAVAEASGQAVPAATTENLEPRTAWENLAVGRILLHAEKYARAGEYFARAIDAQPQAFWPRFYQGACAWHLKDFAGAAQAFGVCVALAPESAECFCDLARAEAELGDSDAALKHFDRALKLNPKLAAAALSRGVLNYQLQHYNDAERDLHHALAAGADVAQVQYNLALAYLAQGRRPAALAALRQALDADPHHENAKRLRRELGGD